MAPHRRVVATGRAVIGGGKAAACQGIGHCIHVSLHGRLFCTARQYDACQTGATVSRRIFE